MIGAESRADAFGEIFDERGEKFEVNRAVFDGRLTRNGFGLGRRGDGAQIDSASAFPELPANRIAESGFEGFERDLPQLTDGFNAAFAESGGMGVADAVKFFDGQRSKEIFLRSRRNDMKAARTAQARSDSGDEFRCGEADGHAEAGAFENLLLHAMQDVRESRIKALGTGEIEIKIVESSGFDRRRERAEDLPEIGRASCRERV